MLAIPRPRPMKLDLSCIPQQETPPHSLDEIVPTQVLTNLHIGEEIGSGGFGTVYCGFLKNERVAVKKLRSNTKTEELVWSSFMAEMRVMQWNHENIIKVLGAMMLKNVPCLVMEFLPGRNLHQLIECQNEIFLLARRVSITSAIASGLEYIHNQGIVHLDIKPANLLMKDQWSCKIADFGCSLKVEELEDDPRPSFYLTGTHAYKAPELLLGEFPTTQADMYSLGVCMWQMLARVEPYTGEDPQLVLFGIATNTVRPKIPAVIPESELTYKNWFENCWQGLPNDRPTSSSLLIELKKTGF